MTKPLVTTEKRIVFGVIGNDIHVVANRILALSLKDAGFRAFNLGTHNKVEDFVAAAIEVEAHAVLVSSLNGEGEHWCVNFRRWFEDAGVPDMPLYIGVNLVVGDRDEEEVVARFVEYGFDRVFYRSADFNEVLNLLSDDVERQMEARQSSSASARAKL